MIAKSAQNLLPLGGIPADIVRLLAGNSGFIANGGCQGTGDGTQTSLVSITCI
jgi:hypothetical protein